MKKGLTDAEYIAQLEAKISSISEELIVVSKECDNLQGVILKMSDELRNLRRMMFGRKSERFIAEDPAQLSLSFEGVEALDEERSAGRTTSSVEHTRQHITLQSYIRC